MKKILITIFAVFLIFISFNTNTSAWEIENNQIISSNILNLNYNEIYLIDTDYNDYLTFDNPNIRFVKIETSDIYKNYILQNNDSDFYIKYQNNENNIEKFEFVANNGSEDVISFLIELNNKLSYKENLDYIFNFYSFYNNLEDNDYTELSVLAALFDKNSNEISAIYNNMRHDGNVFDKTDSIMKRYVIMNNNIFCENIESYCYSNVLYDDSQHDLIEVINNLNEVNSVIITIRYDTTNRDTFDLRFNLELKPLYNNDLYFTPYGLKYNDFNTSQQNQDLIKVFDTNNYFIEKEDIQVLNSEDYSILNGYVAIKDKGTKSININYLSPPTINGSLENFSHVFVFAFKNIGYNSDAGVLSINGSESKYIDNYVYTFIDLGEYTSDFQLPYMNFNITSTNYSSAKVIFGILVSPQFFNLNYVPQEQKYHINDSAVKTFLTSLENSFNTDVDSYNNGVSYGYNQGFNEGVNSGYSDGFKVGYEEGAKEGYQNGLNNSGGNAWKNVWDFIYNIFTFIGKFMDIELVAGVKVGYIVTFIITLSLISFLIHVFKG